MLLGELQNPVLEIPGIGAVTSRALGGIGIHRFVDLLKHLPRAYEDRSTRVGFTEIRGEGTANTTVTVVEQLYIPWRRGRALKVIVTDGGEPASLLCYGRNFLANLLVPGREFRIFGRFFRRRGELQSTVFTVEPSEAAGDEFDRVLPIYPLSAGLTQKLLRKSIRYVLDRYADSIEEEVPEDLLRSRSLPAMGDSISGLHFPDTLEGAENARRSLAYRELFYLQLTMRRRAVDARAAHSADGTSRLRNGAKGGTIAGKVLESLPFELTEDQMTCVDEIGQELAAADPMMRLLQGDVGSGKTLVALLAIARIVEFGEQAAYMAPTELLARQQAESAARILEPAGVRVALLTGSVPTVARRRLVEAMRTGEVDLVVGTHALFSEDVEYRKLGLVVIDEQHRFGVLQRLAALRKGESPDLLLMTATPIPRSLALTVFGDLETSTIRTMPAGRLPIRTHLAAKGRETKVYERVRREIEAGRQAYFVYPLISQSDALDLKDAESMFEELDRKIFPRRRLALIHSKVAEEEKLERMRGFSEGEIDILVATSVVEVGVDVPNATCMVIEHAERFGLAALHQLRGRVGRSNLQSYTFLIYEPDCTEIAKRRLMAMKEITDGFRIAEEDLKMRGPGELTGTVQTGELELRFADLASDFGLLEASHRDVRGILESDPGLLRREHQPIRNVLDRCPPFSGTTTEAG